MGESVGGWCGFDICQNFNRMVVCIGQGLGFTDTQSPIPNI